MKIILLPHWNNYYELWSDEEKEKLNQNLQILSKSNKFYLQLTYLEKFPFRQIELLKGSQRYAELNCKLWFRYDINYKET